MSEGEYWKFRLGLKSFIQCHRVRFWYGVSSEGTSCGVINKYQATPAMKRIKTEKLRLVVTKDEVIREVSCTCGRRAL